MVEWIAPIVVSDLKNHRVQVLTRGDAPTFKLGDSGSEKLNRPLGCVCYKNMFSVVDSGNSCLKVFNSSGNFVRLEKKPMKTVSFQSCMECVETNMGIFWSVTKKEVTCNSSL